MFYNNLITTEITRKYFANKPLLLQTFYKFQTKHKTEKALDYIHVCIEEGLWPKFIRISKKNKKQIRLNAGDIIRLRKRKLNYELKIKTEKLNFLNF